MKDHGNNPILFRVGHVCVGTRWWRRPKTGRWHVPLGPLFFTLGVGPSERQMPEPDFLKGFRRGLESTAQDAVTALVDRETAKALATYRTIRHTDPFGRCDACGIEASRFDHDLAMVLQNQDPRAERWPGGPRGDDF